MILVGHPPLTPPIKGGEELKTFVTVHYMEFKYTVYDKNGKHVNAIASADTLEVLVSRLKNQGLVPLHITEIKSSKKDTKGSGIRVQRKITGRELAAFTRQLSTVLNAGIVLTEALSTLAEDMENASFGAVIEDLVSHISAGEHFSQALSRYPRIFSVTFVAVVKSGEEIGNLGRTLGDLAKYLENFERMKEKFRSAMMYPVFLTGFLIFVVAVIVLFLIPKFKGIFAQAGAKLPLLTRIVVGISEFCLRNVLWGILFSIIFWIVAWYLLRIPKIRYRFDTIVLRLPIFGKLFLKAFISRFCHTLSILLSGGVGISSSLLISSGVVNNLFLMRVISQIRASVISGGSLDEAVRAHAVFPKVVAKMITVGEKSGRLDDMLKRSAEYYDEELEVTLNNFSSLIEPVFIILIGGVVLIVVLALYLPIFHLSSAVR